MWNRATRSPDVSAAATTHVFKLYIAGGDHCETAESLRDLCDEHLQGSYELTVIDVLRRPDLAERERIMAIPTLVRSAPGPALRVTGDLHLREELMRELGLGRPL